MTVNRKSIITSISSYELTNDEKSLIFNKKPWGIILFKRNIKDFSQLKNLTKSIRNLMNDPYYPIMIDEEGGRVSRISKLIDNSNYSQSFFGDIYEKNNLLGLNSYKKYLYFICGFLKELGVNINTIPVLDIIKKILIMLLVTEAIQKKYILLIHLKTCVLMCQKNVKLGVFQSIYLGTVVQMLIHTKSWQLRRIL